MAFSRYWENLKDQYSRIAEESQNVRFMGGRFIGRVLKIEKGTAPCDLVGVIHELPLSFYLDCMVRVGVTRWVALLFRARHRLAPTGSTIEMILLPAYISSQNTYPVVDPFNRMERRGWMSGLYFMDDVFGRGPLPVPYLCAAGFGGRVSAAPTEIVEYRFQDFRPDTISH